MLQECDVRTGNIGCDIPALGRAASLPNWGYKLLRLRHRVRATAPASGASMTGCLHVQEVEFDVDGNAGR